MKTVPLEGSHYSLFITCYTPLSHYTDTARHETRLYRFLRPPVSSSAGHSCRKTAMIVKYPILCVNVQSVSPLLCRQRGQLICNAGAMHKLHSVLDLWFGLLKCERLFFRGYDGTI